MSNSPGPMLILSSMSIPDYRVHTPQVNQGKFYPVPWFLYKPVLQYATTENQGRLFWITYKRLKLLKKAGRLQLIQNSTSSVALMWQYCIRIGIRDNFWIIQLDSRVSRGFDVYEVIKKYYHFSKKRAICTFTILVIFIVKSFLK